MGWVSKATTKWSYRSEPLADTHKTSNQQNNPQADTRLKNNAKFVCQICGYTGHSAKDCRYRVPTTSAYGSLPYSRQSRTENRDFRRDFRRTQNSYHPSNEMTNHTPTDQREETDDNCYQQENVNNSSNQSKNFWSHVIRISNSKTLCAIRTLNTTSKARNDRQLIIGRIRNP